MSKMPKLSNTRKPVPYYERTTVPQLLELERYYVTSNGTSMRSIMIEKSGQHNSGDVYITDTESRKFNGQVDHHADIDCVNAEITSTPINTIPRCESREISGENVKLRRGGRINQ